MTMVLTGYQKFRLFERNSCVVCCCVAPWRGCWSRLPLPRKSAAKSKDAPPPVPTFSTRLPSEETVNAFMKQMFGYDPSVSWKIAAIRPSPAQGLAEVVVVLSNPQGQQNSRLYVTADGQHAVIGDIIPFGDHPFVPAQEALTKGMNGPSRGPADAPVTVVEFSDLQCPHCKEAQPTIDKLMSEEKNVRLVFQNFPLPVARLGRQSCLLRRLHRTHFARRVLEVCGQRLRRPKRHHRQQRGRKTDRPSRTGRRQGPRYRCLRRQTRNRDPGAAIRRVRRGARSHGHANAVCERKKDQQRGLDCLTKY